VAEGDLHCDFQSIRRKRDEFSRMIGEDSHRMNLKRRENLSAHSVLSLLTLKANGFVRIHASFSMGLQFCRSRLTHWMQVQKNAAPFRLDNFHGAIHLFMALARD
jgi:hypothetical protein